MDKFRTIDIEGDGNSSQNKKLFPEGNHFDPGTLIWCVTFCDQDYDTLTLVKKLPETPRIIKGTTGNGMTKAVHKVSTVIPEEIDGHKVVEFTDWKSYLNEIMWQMVITDGEIYSKGYGKYNYDMLVLKSNLERNNLYTGYADVIRHVNTVKWDNTAAQVHTDEYVPNQEYVINGIRHNIEDAVQLAYRINNKEVYNGR